MCFHVKHGTKIKIAETDIECWKAFCQRNVIDGKDVFLSTVFEEPYVYGEKKPLVKIRKYKNKITEGYHSIKHQYGIVLWGFIKRKAIIPAGTRYYENDTEYVSETIMLVE